MKLNEVQINLLTETFFQTFVIPAWREIAETLITEGSCIVAGEGNIWEGGVGNFIERTKAAGAIGCTLLKFDVDAFLKACWVQDQVKHQIRVCEKQLEIVQTNLESAKGLLYEETEEEPFNGFITT